MEYGVTLNGFRRKTYEEIFEDMESRAKNLLGNDVDLSETSPDGMFIRNSAYELSLIWQTAEDTYNSGHVDTAEGLSLRNVGKYIGIKGKNKEKAKTSLQVNGTPGTVISLDLKATTLTGVEFEPIETKTIDLSGSVMVPIQAVVPGVEGNVPANTIVTMVNPIQGIDSVTNPEAAAGGQDEESDPDFRERYGESVAKAGSSTTDSIRAKLLDEVSGVRAAIVVENDSDVEDEFGRPPHSVEAIVLGGEQTDIAQAILQSKAGGIEAYGSTIVVVKDLSGRDKTIGFSYAAQVLIYANINIEKSATYPSDGDNQVKLAFIKYIGGTDTDGKLYNGLSMGKEVVYNKAISEIYKIPGVEDVNLEISTDGTTFIKENILISEMNVAETNHNIVQVSSHE